MWATLTAGKVWRGELQNRRKDGSLMIEATVIAPVFAADGRLESYVAVKHDMTETRRAETALRASEERYRSLIEELDAVVWVWDLESGERFCSPQVLELSGYPSKRPRARASGGRSSSRRTARRRSSDGTRMRISTPTRSSTASGGPTDA